MRKLMATGLILAAGWATAASAQPRDLHAAAAIQAGDFVAAEAILTAERDGRWTGPETLLNLAHVYRQTGRVEAARGLYEQVLADGNVLLTAGTTARCGRMTSPARRWCARRARPRSPRFAEFIAFRRWPRPLRGAAVGVLGSHGSKAIDPLAASA